jgi:K+-transporting ATPase A subunit
VVELEYAPVRVHLAHELHVLDQFVEELYARVLGVEVLLEQHSRSYVHHYFFILFNIGFIFLFLMFQSLIELLPMRTNPNPRRVCTPTYSNELLNILRK